MNKISVAAGLIVFLMMPPAFSAGVSKNYSYFTIGGSTLQELEAELDRLGPKLNSTGKRHPGATRMEFKTTITYGRGENNCRVEDAKVFVNATIILPRWKARKGSELEARVIWNTLSADIKRHEESHVSIAKNHAREIEQAWTSLDPERDCERLAAKGAEASERIMQKHDNEQLRFDRVEGINFEARMKRLLQYRIERIENGRLSE